MSSSEEINQEKRDGTSDGPMSVNSRLELPVLNDVEPKPAGLVPCMSVFAENTYESAAKLLFLAIKWARTIPSFLQVSEWFQCNEFQSFLAVVAKGPVDSA